MTEKDKRHNPHLSDVFDTLLDQQEAGAQAAGATYISVMVSGEGNIVTPNGNVHMTVYSRQPKEPQAARR